MDGTSGRLTSVQDHAGCEVIKAVAHLAIQGCTYASQTPSSLKEARLLVFRRLCPSWDGLAPDCHRFALSVWDTVWGDEGLGLARVWGPES